MPLLVCWKGLLYVARHKDCQACPIKDICLPTGQKRRFFRGNHISPAVCEGPGAEPEPLILRISFLVCQANIVSPLLHQFPSLFK